MIIVLSSIFSIWYILLAHLAFGYGNQNPNSGIKLNTVNFLIPLILTIIFIIIYNIIIQFKPIRTNIILFTLNLLASIYSIYWMTKVLTFEMNKYNLVSFGLALFCIININLIIYKNRKTQSNRIDSVS